MAICTGKRSIKLFLVGLFILLSGCENNESTSTDNKKVKIDLVVRFHDLPGFDKETFRDSFYLVLNNNDSIKTKEASYKWSPKESNVFSIEINNNQIQTVQIIGSSGAVYLKKEFFSMKKGFISIDTISGNLFIYGRNIYERYILTVASSTDRDLLLKHIEGGISNPEADPNH